MFDELFRDHPGGGFQTSGQSFILRAEDAASPDRFAHFGCDGGLSSERIARHTCECVQRNRWMIGVKRGVGAAGSLPLNAQCGGAFDGRLPEGRIEKGFEKHPSQIGDDPS